MSATHPFMYEINTWPRLRELSATAGRRVQLGDVPGQHWDEIAATRFSRHRATAVARLTQTGARLVHDGQMVGRRVRLPVFLGRFPSEPIDTELASFYGSLLDELRDPTFRTGTWRLCERGGWADNTSSEHLVAFP